jgi:hypothetical protein
MRRLARWLSDIYVRARRELLRDSTVTLFERGPEQQGRMPNDGAAVR